jgi:hypothetical protein
VAAPRIWTQRQNFFSAAIRTVKYRGSIDHMSKIVPVLLAGGAGTRLWPVSRDALPKQFLPLVGERSTYQDTLLRGWRTTSCLRRRLSSRASISNS